jgi:hypothetical protein
MKEIINDIRPREEIDGEEAGKRSSVSAVTQAWKAAKK